MLGVYLSLTHQGPSPGDGALVHDGRVAYLSAHAGVAEGESVGAVAGSADEPPCADTHPALGDVVRGVGPSSRA